MESDLVNLNLLINYPLISLKKLHNKYIYTGCICVQGRNFEVRIIQDDNGKYLSVEVINEAKNLEDFAPLLSDSKHVDIVSVLNSLKKELSRRFPKLVDYSATYIKVLNEYIEFTRFYINLKACILSTDLKKITVQTPDESNRIHCLEFVVNYNESKDIFSIDNVDIPEIRVDILKKSCSLTVLYDQCLSLLDSLQPYFEVMDVLDENCFVVDPQKPKRKDNYRRIWIGDNVYVIITIDPVNVGASPGVFFLGPDRKIESYHKRVNHNLENWDRNGDVFQEILNLLGLESFPKKLIDLNTQNNLLKEDEECSICFSLSLNDKLPDIICNNKCCQNYYHTECLWEWLTSINARRVFNEIHGACPNCEKNIACPLPKV